MRRLYLQIYLGFLAILALTVVAAGVLGALLRDKPRMVWATGFAAILAEDLSPDRPAAELQTTLERRGETLQVDLALWDASGNEVASIGPPWPPQPPAGEATQQRGFGPPSLRVRLEDGRWIGMRIRHTDARHSGFFAALAVVALVVALGAYPLARRLTRRLEETRRGVEAFGGGDLDARVGVRGRDEIAALGQSFNAAAERIQSLVDSERRLVANASHELRSPLARLRVALHLIRPDAETKRFLAEAERDIDELDATIGDLLLGSRLEAQGQSGDDPLLDLKALVDEVCEREGVPSRCEPAALRGDAKALARMVANLLDNARRHGDAPIEATLTRSAGGVLVRVLDRGPGLGDATAKRVFEPFFRGPGARGADGGGVGLGLALVRQIARYHGGDARIYPRDGGGCVAEVELPVEAS